MIKRTILLTSLLTLCLFSCKKKEPEETKFNVRVSQSTGSCTLSWDPPYLSEFKNINVYRSTSPIPDPTFTTPIDGSLLLVSIADKTITSLVDSNLVVGNNGIVYYKLVLNFGGRFVVSDLIQVNLNGYSVVLATSSFGNSFSVIKFQQVHRLYYIDYSNGALKSIDYLTGQVSNSVPFTSNGSFPLTPYMNGSSPELFVCTNSYQVLSYDAITLALKYTISVGGSISGICVKNNFLYVTTNQSTLLTYDLTTKTLVNQKTFTSNVNSYSLKPFAGPNNSLFVRYLDSYYNSAYSQYFYVNRVKIYKLVNGVPNDSSFVNSAVVNADSSQSSNTYVTIELSPDGKYLTYNNSGFIYSVADHATYDLHTSHNFAPIPSFSADGQYLTTKPPNVFGTYTIDAFILPGFTFAKSIRSPNNVTNSGIAWDDFPTHDTLVSYTVKQAQQGGQVASTLTVFFNKMN